MSGISKHAKAGLLVAYLVCVGIPENQSVRSYYAKIRELPDAAIDHMAGSESWKVFRSVWLVQETGLAKARGMQLNLKKTMAVVCEWDDGIVDSVMAELCDKGLLTFGRNVPGQA